jgi:hypothetical protein
MMDLDMPMHGQMNAPWYMGHWEWIELGVFWIAALIVIALLLVFLNRPTRARESPLKVPLSGWRAWPETRLIMLGLPLELLWETAQFPLYDVWHQNDWGYILYGLAHCTFGDLLILLAAYEIVALLRRNRGWYLTHAVSGAVLFTLLGAGYTIYSEILNVRIKGTWGYTELMPLVPGIDIGGMPLLQWLLIPPILLWLMRQTSLLRTSSR